MWILLVLQLTAGSATSHNSMPITFTGVSMQEFSSLDTCEAAKKTIDEMSTRRNNTEKHTYPLRDGIIEMKCVKK